MLLLRPLLLSFSLCPWFSWPFLSFLYSHSLLWYVFFVFVYFWLLLDVWNLISFILYVVSFCITLLFLLSVSVFCSIVLRYAMSTQGFSSFRSFDFSSLSSSAFLCLVEFFSFSPSLSPFVCVYVWVFFSFVTSIEVCMVCFFSLLCSLLECSHALPLHSSFLWFGYSENSFIFFFFVLWFYFIILSLHLRITKETFVWF